MSRFLAEIIQHQVKLPARQKAVLMALAFPAHHDGTHAYPSQQTMANESGLSLRNVQRGLRELEAAGYIVPEAYNGGGRGHAVQYTIRLDVLGINPATMADFSNTNPATMADFTAKPRQNERQTPPKQRLNPATMAYQSGRESEDVIKEEEERAPSRASSSLSFEKKEKAETRDQSSERDLLAPFTGAEIDTIVDPETGEANRPCETTRAVLWALWEASDNYEGTGTKSPHRAWLQYVPIFLAAHATPDEIITGYHLMQNKYADMEHKPGVKKLAEYWDEWQSKAKAEMARDDAEIRRQEEDRQLFERLQREEAEARACEAEARAREQARRAAMTPEERAQEDAEIQRIAQEQAAAERQRWEERMAAMRQATAPRVQQEVS